MKGGNPSLQHSADECYLYLF